MSDLKEIKNDSVELDTELEAGQRTEDVTMKNDETETSEKESFSIKKEIFSWVMVFVVAGVLSFVISRFIIINAVVPTGSMISTINEKDKIIGNRLAYRFADPKKGDIVLFWSPIKKDTIYVKRLIGLPGDTIKIEGGKLYVNNVEQVEPYVHGKPTYAYSGRESEANIGFEYTLKKDEYFMMGDNRTGSTDSRAWGPVKRNAIIAKGVCKWADKDGLHFKKLK